MSTDKENCAGIYQIQNLENGRIYIGSAYCFKQRWHRHLVDLKKQRHHNKYLQNDYNKYSENKFSFSVLEICDLDKEKIRGLEQRYLDDLWKNTDFDERYNHTKNTNITYSKQKRKIKYEQKCVWLFDGIIEYAIFDLEYFSKHYNVDHTELMELISGEIDKISNWVRGNNKQIIVKHIDTQEEIETNSFCNGDLAKKMKIQQSHLSKLLSGKRKRCGKWIVKNRVFFGRQHNGKTYYLLSPQNKVIEVNNLSYFAKKNNLNINCLKDIVYGKKKSYKKWKLNR